MRGFELRDHAELGLGDGLDPAFDLQAFVLGGLQVLEVLLERFVVELGEEVRLGGLVELADPVDQLTFVHVGYTFANRRTPRAARGTAARVLPRLLIGHRAART